MLFSTFSCVSLLKTWGKVTMETVSDWTTLHSFDSYTTSNRNYMMTSELLFKIFFLSLDTEIMTMFFQCNIQRYWWKGKSEVRGESPEKSTRAQEQRMPILLLPTSAKDWGCRWSRTGCQNIPTVGEPLFWFSHAVESINPFRLKWSTFSRLFSSEIQTLESLQSSL